MKKQKKEFGIFIIPTEEGLLIESRIPVDVSFVNKINNDANKQKILSHLKDMKCQHHINQGDGSPVSVLSQTTYEHMSREQLETLIKVISANHDSFIENVEKRMVEDTPANIQEKKNEDEKDNKKLKATAELLKNLEHFENDDRITLCYGKLLCIPFAEIQIGFFKEIIDAFIDKQLENG